MTNDLLEPYRGAAYLNEIKFLILTSSKIGVWGYISIFGQFGQKKLICNDF